MMAAQTTRRTRVCSSPRRNSIASDRVRDRGAFSHHRGQDHPAPAKATTWPRRSGSSGTSTPACSRPSCDESADAVEQRRPVLCVVERPELSEEPPLHVLAHHPFAPPGEQQGRRADRGGVASTSPRICSDAVWQIGRRGLATDRALAEQQRNQPHRTPTLPNRKQHRDRTSPALHRALGEHLLRVSIPKYEACAAVGQQQLGRTEDLRAERRLQ
jgi:hypothetical protein